MITWYRWPATVVVNFRCSILRVTTYYYEFTTPHLGDPLLPDHLDLYFNFHTYFHLSKRIFSGHLCLLLPSSRRCICAIYYISKESGFFLPLSHTHRNHYLIYYCSRYITNISYLKNIFKNVWVVGVFKFN